MITHPFAWFCRHVAVPNYAAGVNALPTVWIILRLRALRRVRRPWPNHICSCKFGPKGPLS